MVFILFAAIFASMPAPPTLLKITTEFARTRQQNCSEFLSWKMKHSESLKALLCGKELSTQPHQETLKRSSLIHLFIVSGSHLLLLDYFLSKFSIPFFLRFVVLGFFSVLVGWQAPVARALLHLGIGRLLRQWILPIPLDLRVLISGLLCLALFPDWQNSRSLQMSWCASLCFSTPALFPRWNSLQRIVFLQVAIFLAMAPMLYGFGSLHPLSVLYNIFLGHFIAALLLPLAVFCIPLPPLRSFFDGTMDLFYHLTTVLTGPIQIQQSRPLNTLYLWLWIAFLHITIFIGRRLLLKGKDFERR